MSRAIDRGLGRRVLRARVRPYPGRVTAGGRTYQIRTYGCQMNVHDSERLAGLLDEAGYGPPATARPPTWWCSTPARSGRTRTTGCTATSATCCRSRKNPGMQIAVGGCLAQKDRGRITQRAPWVDVVFGTHNIGLAARAARAGPAQRARPGRDRSRRWRCSPRRCRPGASRPTRPGSSISVGCNNTCTFCIVPSLRGKEKDRRPGDILAEIRALVADGRARGHAARPERELLRRRSSATAARSASCCAACGEIEGLERVRFTSPHPRGLHRRRHRRHGRDPERHAAAAHAAAVGLGPHAAGACAGPTAASGTWRSSTGSGPRSRTPRSPPTSSSASPARPRRTSRRPWTWSRHARFAGAFTFQYSIRPGHAGRRPWTTRSRRGRAGALRAARRAGRGDTPGRRTRSWSARRVEVLVAEGEGRKDAATTGCPAGPGTTAWCTSPRPRPTPRPGDVVTVTVTRGAPHYLLSDAAPLSVRRTRAGDAWETAAAASAPVSAAPVSAAPVRRRGSRPARHASPSSRRVTRLPTQPWPAGGPAPSSAP